MLKSGNGNRHSIQNQILSLPPEESERLLRHLEFVSVRSNDVLYGEGERVWYAYFPQNAVVSQSITTLEGETVEVAMTGGEGMLGVQAILGEATSPTRAVVQVPGECCRLKIEVLAAEFQRDGMLQPRVLYYTRFLLAQLSQTAVCNRVHLLPQRFSRWLLMLQSRTNRDTFSTTHESISQRLGVSRSELSLAAEKLRAAGIIDYQRGSIRIADQSALVTTSCECYQTDKEEIQALGKAYRETAVDLQRFAVGA